MRRQLFGASCAASEELRRLSASAVGCDTSPPKWVAIGKRDVCPVSQR
jgi:hypothetical protein